VGCAAESCAGELDLVICKGATFSYALQWGTEPKTYKAITGITNAAPAVVTVPGHGLPDGWRVAVTAVRGMKEVNALSTPPRTSDLHMIEVVDASHIRLLDVNAVGYHAYTSGGVLEFATPVDLSLFNDARMDIKAEVDDVTPLFTLSVDNGRITLNNTTKTIELLIDASDTAALDFDEGVYSLEVEDTGGEVVLLLEGQVSVRPEITTSA